MTLTLVSAVDCRYCRQPVYLALCRDGKRRTFERRELPAGTPGVWAWRRHQGMEETELVPGHGLHYCAEYRQAFAGVRLSGGPVVPPV